MRRNLFQEIMDESILMPGFLDLVVTRGFAYQWLKDCGYDPSGRGFASLDYMIFSKKPVLFPLTDSAIRDKWLGQVRNDFMQD